MIKQLSNSKTGGVFLIVLAIMLSACGDVAAAALTHFPPCPPAENAYTNPIEPNYVSLYENSVVHSNDSALYDNDREVAFKELVNRVYDWSDTVDINTEGKNVRITITYISPAIAQLIVINHYIYKRILNLTGRLEEQIKSQMAGIVNRNEHIFFVTIMTSPSADGIPLVFPLSQLSLTNTSNLTVYPEHDDHNLEGPIILKNYPEYGFIYYSMAITKNGNCQAVFDKNRDTRIVLSIPQMSIANGEVGFQSWKYKYAPLINMKSVSSTRKNKFEVLPTGQFTPENNSPSLLGDIDKPDFWVWLTRLIWVETTLDP